MDEKLNPQVPEPQTTSEPSTKTNKWIFGGGIVLILAVILIGGYFLIGSRTKNIPNTNIPNTPVNSESTNPSVSPATSTGTTATDSQDQQIDQNLNQLNSDQQGVDSSLNDQSVNLQ